MKRPLVISAAASVASVAMLAAGAGCQRTRPEPTPTVDASAPAPRRPTTHVITEADHLAPLDLAVGDRVAAPADDVFEWTLRIADGDALAAEDPFACRAVRLGPARLVARGDPKCKRQDGGCGTSTREWTLFIRVR